MTWEKYARALKAVIVLALIAASYVWLWCQAYGYWGILFAVMGMWLFVIGVNWATSP
jgi:hypothetical protein